MINPNMPFYVKGYEKELKLLDKSSKEYLVVTYTKPDAEILEIDARFIIGQASVREYIKNCIDSIDLDLSFVLVEDVPFGVHNGKPSVYQFMKWISKNYDDGFDIDDYVKQREEDQKIDEEFEKRRNAFDTEVPETYQTNQISDTLSNEGKEGIE